MPLIRRKVYAYITNQGRLLVFTHTDFPEAGIQVPGGTLEPGEPPEEGALREAQEETGLASLEMVALLGERRRDLSDIGLDEVHHRTFYHLRCPGNPPERWQHLESHRSDGIAEPLLFQFFWAPLPDGVPPLIAGLGDLLPELRRFLDEKTDGQGKKL